MKKVFKKKEEKTNLSTTTNERHKHKTLEGMPQIFKNSMKQAHPKHQSHGIGKKKKRASEQ